MKQPKYNNKSVDKKLMDLKALVIMICVFIIAAGLMGGCVVIKWLGRREDWSRIFLHLQKNIIRIF